MSEPVHEYATVLVEDLMEIICAADNTSCEDLYHETSELHKFGDECPPYNRLRKAIDAVESVMFRGEEGM